MAAITRRNFIGTGIMAGMGAQGAGHAAPLQAPAVHAGKVRPVVIASGNGNRHTHDGDLTCVEIGIPTMGT